MSELRIIGNCENCLHKNVCQYKEGRKETLSQIEGKIDNIAYDSENMFIFKSECKYFRNNCMEREGIY